ncbi:MAG: hypothetical protein K8J08_18660 [Thermoanaerobaculia bacterium]|nr:hypothetical protein [Thermoanaerobaculia bacterium]
MVLGTGSESQGFALGGVWTPSPSNGRWPGDYRGDEARDRVRALLEDPGTTISRRWNPRGGREPFVGFLVPSPVPAEALGSLDPTAGLSLDRVDLAVLLALEGLALCDRTTAFDSRHADAICVAEREARRRRRGLHDGGFLDSRSRRHDLVEIGELPERRSSASEQPPDPGWWAADDSTWILHSPDPLAPQEAIPSVRRKEKGKKKGGKGGNENR